MTGRSPTLLLILVLPGVLPAAGETPAKQSDKTHWSFRTLARPPVPAVKDGGRVRTAVDAFVLAGLEARGLTFAAEADPRTLIRRLALDLTGLPPSPEEVEAFCADARPDVCEILVDRLLASPHFGERWGRHWLDNAGYVDVTGGDNDAATVKLGADKWRYRDWVIDAFNADLPFDRFLTEQLAGDELIDWRAAPAFTPEVRRLLIATGFLRVGADDTDENELAARMQLAAGGVLDLSREPAASRKLYGLDNPATAGYGLRCLMARRLVESGVRFVQVFPPVKPQFQPWDAHTNVKTENEAICARCDLPSAGLIKDLKARGLLDETIVVWSGEFGRLPVSQNGAGRDHNRNAFSLILAGGGFKAGYVHGATDEVGYRSVEGRVRVADLHATLLHQLGLDHTRLSYRHHGSDETLTDARVTSARVVDELLT